MELNNDFRVSVPPLEAWKVLTDVERIAPLLPGAQLQEVDGDEYKGIVKVKVGPITAQYKGTAQFLEQDQSSGHLVLKASGRDTRGQGNASATITVDMGPEGDGTKVGVVTDLTITGKVAQFGRGVLAEVTEKLITQFVDALEADIQSGGDVPAAEVAADEGDAPAAEAADTPEKKTAAEPDSAAGPRRIYQPEPTPVDLLDAAGASVAKRLLPLAGVGLVLLVLVLLSRRRHSHAGAPAVPDALVQAVPGVGGGAGPKPALPDLSGAQEAGRKAARRAQQAATAELRQLAVAQELTRKAARQAQQAAAVELRELAAAQDLTRKAAKRAREAARRQ